MSQQSAVAPLQSLLDNVLSRLSVLEGKVGVEGVAAPAASDTGSVPLREDAPFVKAYDDYLEAKVKPLVDAIAALKGDDAKLKEMSTMVNDAWTGVRTILVLASRSKKPADAPKDLQPHLKPIQTALGSLQKLRLDRSFDWHQKALMEMSGGLSWILIAPPPQTPAAFVKEAIASSTFWSNKIRKDFKNKAASGDADAKAQIAFCDCLKGVADEMVAYIMEHHRTGLTWNHSGGVSLEEAAKSLDANTTAPAAQKAPAPAAGGIGSLMAELAKKQSADGSSAATGLKHVARDQQTWRKEYKGEKSSVIPAAKAPAPSTVTKKPASTKPAAKPVLEYHDRGHKWIVENQTKESANGAPLEVKVSDAKQQVYLYNCSGVTIKIDGEKVKSIILDKCTSTAVVFDSCISACEVVNCKKIQLQTTGTCPTFTLDKTDGVVVYLSFGTLEQTSFVTSQSSEMNVSYPLADGDNAERKELPIPEQFVHKLNLKDNSLSSEVSDLYH